MGTSVLLLGNNTSPPPPKKKSKKKGAGILKDKCFQNRILVCFALFALPIEFCDFFVQIILFAQIILPMHRLGWQAPYSKQFTQIWQCERTANDFLISIDLSIVCSTEVNYMMWLTK